jgi:hypothetical protein
MALPGRWRGSLRKFHGRQMGHEQKEHGVRGNVKIKIHKAMNEKAATGDKACELQSAGKRIVELAQPL